MNGWSNADIPDQAGRTAVVTGANSGIGLETTRALVSAGATVIMGCRDPERGATARETLLAEQPARSEHLIVHRLDLADPHSIATFVDGLGDEIGHIDLLINNAGVMAVPPQLTDSGVERQWATNHLGHFALTGLLLPRLVAARPDGLGARVVSVSSLAAAGGNVDDGVRTDLTGYTRFGVYSDTKLANQVFAVELNHRLASAGSRAISVVAHPGVSHTNLASSVGLPIGTRALLLLSRFATQPAAEGALPILRAATDPAVEGGQYYGPDGRKQQRGSPKQVPLIAGAANRSLGRMLWAQSIERSGVRYLAGQDS